MIDLLPVFDQIRLWASQVLAMQFSSWVLMLPFGWFALNELLKLLKRIH